MKTSVPIVNLLGPIEAEAHLKLMFREQSSHIIAHESPIGLNPVLKRKLRILSLKADDGAEKIEARQEGLTAVPVDLNYLGVGVNSQIVGDDAARIVSTVERPIIPPECSWKQYPHAKLQFRVTWIWGTTCRCLSQWGSHACL